jgi:catechol 2,3-dioxygenase-like lactoylglutathione lyase family enzyme
VLRLGMVVLGVTDLRRAVDFWSQALGYRLRDGGPGGHWAVLTPASGSGTELALQRRSSGWCRLAPSGSTGTCIPTTPTLLSLPTLRATASA